MKPGELPEIEMGPFLITLIDPDERCKGEAAVATIVFGVVFRQQAQRRMAPVEMVDSGILEPPPLERQIAAPIY